MEETARRGPRGRIFGISVLILVAIAIAWMGLVTTLSSRGGNEAQKRTDQLLVEIQGLTSTRPVLRGTAVPGNAWEEYDLALAEMKAAKQDQKHFTAISDYLTRQKKADRDAVEALVKKHESALTHLRQGVQRSEARYAYRWERGGSMELPSLLDAQRLANLATAQARLLEEAGHHGEAASLLLDTAQLGHDLAFNGPLISLMIGVAIYGIAFEELRDVILSGKLTKEESAEVDRELAILDRGYQSARVAFLTERLCMGFSLMDPALSGEGNRDLKDRLIDTFGAWRYGFSRRLETAQGLKEMDEALSRSAEACERSWAEVQAVSADVGQKIENSHNRVFRYAVAGLLSCERGVRERQAHLRLLRAAAHYRAAGEFLELADPFGSKMLQTTNEGKVKFWSVGRDGQDNGGQGGWRTFDIGKDIVLEFGS